MSQAVVERFKGLKPSYKAAIAVVVVATLWMVSGVFSGGENAHDKVQGSPEQSVPRVRVTTVTSKTYTPVISVTGRLQAGKAVNVRVEVPGRVTEVVAEKGQRVEAGAVLLRIDPEDRPQRLSEAKARLKQREIAYESAKKLSKGGYSSQLNVAQAKADLEAARALVTRMQRDLSNTTIVAPFAGVVDTLPVEQGDYFDKAGQIAARMLDLTSVKGVGEVTERDIDHVALGKPAQVRLPSGLVLDGVVTYVAQSSAALTRTFPVEVTAQVPDGSVAEGLTAEIILPLESVVAHRISPALLTLDDNGQIGVKIVGEQNEVEFHSAELVSDTKSGVWLNGLPEQIRVITVGQEFVRAGQQVEAVEGGLPSMAPGGEAN